MNDDGPVDAVRGLFHGLKANEHGTFNYKEKQRFNWSCADHRRGESGITAIKKAKIALDSPNQLVTPDASPDSSTLNPLATAILESEIPFGDF